MHGIDENYDWRPVRDGDADGLIRLIGGCFREYADQGVVIDLDDMDSDLHAYASHIATLGGEAFVVEEYGEIIALVSYADHDGGRFELKRLYVQADRRGGGFARALVDHVEMIARGRGGKTTELWSDSRFTRAHSFYRREGYNQMDETRSLGDISDTTELHFIKEL